MKKYKSIIKDVYKTLHDYEYETTWNKVEITKHDFFIALYQSKTGNIHKCQAILDVCDKTRLLKIILDAHYPTRKQWDNCTLLNIEQLEIYEPINSKIIRCVKTIPLFGTYPREFIGLQTVRHDKSSDTHTISYQTLYHDKYPPRLGFVEAVELSIIQISPHGQDNQLITMYSKVFYDSHFDGYLQSCLGMTMANQIVLYNNTIKDVVYDEIYKEWECKKCKTKWNISQEKCRHCHKEKD